MTEELAKNANRLFATCALGNLLGGVTPEDVNGQALQLFVSNRRASAQLRCAVIVLQTPRSKTHRGSRHEPENPACRKQEVG